MKVYVVTEYNPCYLEMRPRDTIDYILGPPATFSTKEKAMEAAESVIRTQEFEEATYAEPPRDPECLNIAWEEVKGIQAWRTTYSDSIFQVAEVEVDSAFVNKESN